MYCDTKSLVNPLIQKKTDRFYGSKDKMRQFPVPAIYDLRVVYKKEKDVIQKTDDVIQKANDGPELFQQIGPSCWLFVLEALLRAAGLDTKYIQIIMYSYESDAGKIGEKEKNPAVKNRRVAALLATKDKLDNLKNKLEHYKSNKDKSGNQGDNIFREHVERLLFRSIGNTKFLQHIFSDQDRPVKIDDLISEIDKARQKLDALIGICQNTEDDTAAFFNAGSTQIDNTQDIGDVEATLKYIEKPSYMSICRIYKIQKTDTGDVIDFTERPDSNLKDTSHAVMLLEYDEVGKKVKYKDPNYGNAIFIVTVEQLKRMAGDDKIVLRTIYKENIDKSKLAAVL